MVLRWNATALLTAATVEEGLLQLSFHGAPTAVRWGGIAAWLVIAALAILWGTAPLRRRWIPAIPLTIAVIFTGYVTAGQGLLFWVAIAIWGVDRMPNAPRLWLALVLWAAIPALPSEVPHGAALAAVVAAGLASAIPIRWPSRITSTQPTS